MAHGLARSQLYAALADGFESGELDAQGIRAVGERGEDELAVGVAHALARNTRAFVRREHARARNDGPGIIANQSDERCRRDLCVDRNGCEKKKRSQQQNLVTVIHTYLARKIASSVKIR